MKRFTLILAALAIVFGLKAQCPHSEAIDFTATDCHGTEVHLFDILDHGQSVLIDFFYTTCGPCQQATPKVAEAYTRLGCNMHDVFFVEISPSDNDAACQNWCNNYGIEYPTIGTTGGGSSICSQYGITAYPTVILITPDHHIVINDLWPISNSQTIVDQLAPYGIQEHDCTVADPANVDITIGEVGFTSIETTFTPNETCAEYKYVCGRQEDMEAMMQGLGLTLEQLIIACGYTATGETTITFTENILPGTEYTIHVLPYDAAGTTYDISTETVTTLANETLTFSVDTLYTSYDYSTITIYNYTAEPEVTITKLASDFDLPLYMFRIGEQEIGEGEEIEVVIPQGESIDVDVVINIIETRDITHTPVLVSNTLADVSFMTIWDNTLNATETSNTINLYPNPANEFITLNAENINSVVVFNAIGQKVDEFIVNDNQVKIATSNYENGIYFLQVNGADTYRFVVTH